MILTDCQYWVTSFHFLTNDNKCAARFLIGYSHSSVKAADAEIASTCYPKWSNLTNCLNSRELFEPQLAHQLGWNTLLGWLNQLFSILKTCFHLTGIRGSNNSHGPYSISIIDKQMPQSEDCTVLTKSMNINSSRLFPQTLTWKRSITHTNSFSDTHYPLSFSQTITAN